MVSKYHIADNSADLVSMYPNNHITKQPRQQDLSAALRCQLVCRRNHLIKKDVYLNDFDFCFWVSQLIPYP